MANNMQITNAVASTAMDAVTALLNAGTLKIYDGTQPVTGNNAIGSASTNNLLVTLTFGNPAFGASASGVATANAITAGNAIASSTATWARLFKSDGTTPVCDLSVGTSASDIVLNTTTITSGVQVAITSMTLTHPLH